MLIHNATTIEKRDYVIGALLNLNFVYADTSPRIRIAYSTACRGQLVEWLVSQLTYLWNNIFFGCAVPPRLEVSRADLKHIQANLKLFKQTWKWRPFFRDHTIPKLWEKGGAFSEVIFLFGEHTIHLEILADSSCLLKLFCSPTAMLRLVRIRWGIPVLLF